MVVLLRGNFYQTDYTNQPLLFIADGNYLADKGSAEHLAGDQWGMMNESVTEGLRGSAMPSLAPV